MARGGKNSGRPTGSAYLRAEGRAAVQISYEYDGLDRCRAFLDSLEQALDNAGLPDGGELCVLENCEEGVRFDGALIVEASYLFRQGAMLVTLMPTWSIHLFAAAVMTALPARARLRWDHGWPLFHCDPPSDGGGRDDVPGPVTPSELVPA